MNLNYMKSLVLVEMKDNKFQTDLYFVLNNVRKLTI